MAAEDPGLWVIANALIGLHRGGGWRSGGGWRAPVWAWEGA
jgi:hypothetical protein